MPERGVGPRIDASREPRGVRRFSHDAMATSFEVQVVHPDAGYAAQAAHAGFDVVDRLERELSRFLPNSDVGRINVLAAGESTRVSHTTLECLWIARHAFELTGGAFDVSIGTGLTSLDLDPENCVVTAERAGVRIDLGGIGKGYAVDAVAEVLEEWDLGCALVHGGFSSVLALDAPPECDGWPLTLSDPGDLQRVLVRLSVHHTAIGASGVRKGEHIIDPRTGEPSQGCRAAWASVPRPERARSGAEEPPRVAQGAIADALATAFMVLDPEDVQALCARSPGLEAWILTHPAGNPNGQAHLLHAGGPAAHRG